MHFCNTLCDADAGFIALRKSSLQAGCSHGVLCILTISYMPKISGVIWHVLQTLATLEAVFIDSMATQGGKLISG